jgi:hypothetical protein
MNCIWKASKFLSLFFIVFFLISSPLHLFPLDVCAESLSKDNPSIAITHPDEVRVTDHIGRLAITFRNIREEVERITLHIDAQSYTPRFRIQKTSKDAGTIILQDVFSPLVFLDDGTHLVAVDVQLRDGKHISTERIITQNLTRLEAGEETKTADDYPVGIKKSSSVGSQTYAATSGPFPVNCAPLKIGKLHAFSVAKKMLPGVWQPGIKTQQIQNVLGDVETYLKMAVAAHKFTPIYLEMPTTAAVELDPEALGLDTPGSAVGLMILKNAELIAAQDTIPAFTDDQVKIVIAADNLQVGAKLAQFFHQIKQAAPTRIPIVVVDQISFGDVELAGFFDWSEGVALIAYKPMLIALGTAQGSVPDVALNREHLGGVLAHELGHGLSLGHTTSPESLMYPTDAGGRDLGYWHAALAVARLCTEGEQPKKPGFYTSDVPQASELDVSTMICGNGILGGGSGSDVEQCEANFREQMSTSAISHASFSSVVKDGFIELPFAVVTRYFPNETTTADLLAPVAPYSSSSGKPTFEMFEDADVVPYIGLCIPPQAHGIFGYKACDWVGMCDFTHKAYQAGAIGEDFCGVNGMTEYAMAKKVMEIGKRRGGVKSVSCGANKIDPVTGKPLTKFDPQNPTNICMAQDECALVNKKCDLTQCVCIPKQEVEVPGDSNDPGDDDDDGQDGDDPGDPDNDPDNDPDSDDGDGEDRGPKNFEFDSESF